MQLSFRIFLLFFIPFVAAAADHFLLGGALAAAMQRIVGSPGP